MSATPVFIKRLRRVLDTLAYLTYYPDGVPVALLADRAGIGQATLLEDLEYLRFLESELRDVGMTARNVLEVVSPSGSGSHGHDAIVRLINNSADELGVRDLTFGELAALFTAGTSLLAATPDDTALAAALESIAEDIYGVGASLAPDPNFDKYLPKLRDAMDQRRLVKIKYSRTWEPGITERTIEPYRLLMTERGWELDAGPVTPDGALRTYIVSNIRAARPLKATFEEPVGLPRLLERQRETTRVRVRLPQHARWVAHQYAEQVDVVKEDTATFTADLHLLRPVADRVGLILLAGGPTSVVIRPGSILPESVGLIEQLLEHHREPPAQH